MNNMAPRQVEREIHRESRVSKTPKSAADEQKLIEGQMQLEEEAEARKRRVHLRKQRQAKLDAKRRLVRRKRAFKLAGVWMAVIAGGFFATTWFTHDVLALISN